MCKRQRGKRQPRLEIKIKIVQLGHIGQQKLIQKKKNRKNNNQIKAAHAPHASPHKYKQLRLYVYVIFDDVYVYVILAHVCLTVQTRTRCRCRAISLSQWELRRAEHNLASSQLDKVAHSQFLIQFFSFSLRIFTYY